MKCDDVHRQSINNIPPNSKYMINRYYEPVVCTEPNRKNKVIMIIIIIIIIIIEEEPEFPK
jgi:hypothetical protein